MAFDFSVRFFDLDRVVVDEGLLSDGERARVARKATPGLRQRQAASFQCLRQTLGEVLARPPESLEFRIPESGKPALADASIRFNLSHSGGIGMLAWGPRELGVDVEAWIARPSDGLADEILCAPERERWQGLEPADRCAWLTRTWTRKEAALKALGSGLRIPPRHLDVGGGEGEGGEWSVVLENRRWRGIDWTRDVPEGFRAAVCILDAHG